METTAGVLAEVVVDIRVTDSLGEVNQCLAY